MDVDSQIESFNSSIDDLPILAFELILKHLDIKSLVRCSAVSKKWQSSVHEFKIQELIIKNEYNTHWHFFYTRDRIDAKNIAENFDAENIGTICLNLSNLKRLMINSKWDKKEVKTQFVHNIMMTPLYIYVHDLNKFSQLEQLKLDGINVGGRETRRLHLPKLKILDLWLGNFDVIMDLPCLKAINCYRLNPIRLVDPTTVEHIRVCAVEGGVHLFANYKNLTHLQLDDVLDLRENEDILQSLPNLRMFDGDQITKYRSEREAYYYTYKHVKKMYNNNLLKEKQLLRRDGLKICFGQIEIEDGKRFEDYDDFRDYFDC